MSTPLDKCGYMFTESYGPGKHYRLVLGFENLDDLHAAQDYVVSLRQKGPTPETGPVCSGCQAPNTRGALLESGKCTVCEAL